MTVQAQSTQRNESSFSTAHGVLVRHNISEKWMLDIDQTFPWTLLSTSRLQLMQQKNDRPKNKLVRERNIFPVPFHLINGIPGGDNASQLSESSVSQSSCERETPERHLTSLSETQSCAASLSTEQSSLYSCRYDEFDRENTQRVRQLFSEVDELLYEGSVSSSSVGLQEECREWNAHSPHLRILGNQLDSPNQEGFQFVPSRWVSSGENAVVLCEVLCEDRGEHDLACTLKLYVEGRGLSPTPCPLQSASTPTQSLCKHSCLLQEEVYEKEGRIEEFLAYDAEDTENVWVDAGRAGRPGAPPMSPHACIREAVTDEAFDDVWREAVHSVRELLYKHWKRHDTDGALEGLGRVLGDPSPHINNKCQNVPLSRGSNRRSMLLWPNCSPGTQASQVFKMNLNGVMTIQAKPLQQRQQGFTEKANQELEDRPNPLWIGRAPGPSVFSSRGACRTPPNRASAQRLLHLPRLSGCSRPCSTSRTSWPRGRARSCLSQSHNVPCQPPARGHSLSTVTEGQSSPFLSSLQNQRLLPLLPADQSELEPTVFISAPRYMQPKTRILHGNMGGHFPVPISTLPPLKEPTLLLESMSRPNTTHTLWSDTPMKWSFAPMDFSCHARTGKGPHPGDHALIGVTGFGVGINCPASNGLSENAVVTRRRQRPPSSSTDGGSVTGPMLLGVPHHNKVFGRFPGNVKKKPQVLFS
ncbi:hypothetical protein UPYG_G00213090 [Umbra pygmaea]|uniref:DUF3719 domain-containing protein n=1 Tax=Umbra pygmaea TaxID=75934 RepID=A0ABD0WK62_UMBPY